MAILFYTYNKHKTHSGLLLRQTRFLKVNVFTLKYVTTAYSSHLSRDFTAFDQSFFANHPEERRVQHDLQKML